MATDPKKLDCFINKTFAKRSSFLGQSSYTVKLTCQVKKKDDNMLFGQPAIAQIVGKEKGNFFPCLNQWRL